ncbi:MAG: hypothetical protein AAFV29_04845, partial [Myxococcota bacterium]
ELQDEVCVQGLDRIARSQAEGALRNDVHPACVMSTFIILTSHWWHFRHVTERWKELKDAPPVPEGEALDELFFKDMMKIFMEGVSPR